MAQTVEIRYGFIRDGADPTRIIAVALPNAELVGDAITINQGGVFSFYLPAGTIGETTPEDVQSDLAFTAYDGAVWHVEAFTDSLMDSFNLDTGNRDLYSFSLRSTLAEQSVAGAIPLFSFSLPNGCDGGFVEPLAADDSFAAALSADYEVSVGNFLSGAVSPATDPIVLYADNAGSLACEEVTLAISVAYFYAHAEAFSTTIRWHTATETGVAGYNLLAEEAGSLRQLNTALIPSQTIDAMGPSDYRFTTPTQAANMYLEEVRIDGRSRRHGPYALGETYGSPVISDYSLVEPIIYLPVIHR